MSAPCHPALAAAALALAALAAVWAHILSPSFGGTNKCEMTYMRPGYLPVPLPATLANDRGYALFLYREGMMRASSGDARREVGRLGAPSPDGTRATPAIFLPGNGGSFKQVRSVGAESHRISAERARAETARRTRVFSREADETTRNDETDEWDEKDETFDTTPRLDWFAVSFGEELSAFSGALLEDQTTFAARVIEHVASMYAEDTPPGRDAEKKTGDAEASRARAAPRASAHVVVLGHSMGGLAARGALLDSTRRDTLLDSTRLDSGPPGDMYSRDLAVTLITLATPHAYSPATTTKGAARRLARLNEAWRAGKDSASERVALASVTGGDRDRQVLASHASIAGVVDARFGFEVEAGDMPNTPTDLSADHRCVLWCNQVVAAVANAALDAARVETSFQESFRDADIGDGAEGRGVNVSRRIAATRARRAALAARLVGDEKGERTTRARKEARPFFSARSLARGALRWTPSLVPAAAAAAFARAGAASPRLATRDLRLRGGFVREKMASSGRGDRGESRRRREDAKTSVLVGAGAFLFACSAVLCAWLPAAGAAAGAGARVVFSARAARRDERAMYRCVAHVVTALAALPSAVAAALCAWHAAALPAHEGALAAKLAVALKSPFLRRGEDAWWALAAAAPAWLEADPPTLAAGELAHPLADVLESAALYAAAAVAAGAAVPGRAHEAQTAAALAGVGSAAAALLRRRRAFSGRGGRGFENRGKTKTG